MKFLHLADLHLGRRFDDISLIIQQKYVLKQALETAKETDCVLLCGDIYDSTHPDKEAISLFSWFISQLAEMKKRVYIIGGNHDGDILVSHMSEIVRSSNIFIYPVFEGNIQSHIIYDEYGHKIVIHLLPYLNLEKSRNYFPYYNLNNTNDCIRTVIDNTDIDSNSFNIICSHQLIRYAERCDSEEAADLNRDAVDADNYSRFDYVAMGHLHRPQFIGRNSFRYSGSIYKYSFSESSHPKSFCIMEIDSEAQCHIQMIPVDFLNNVEVIQDCFDNLMKTDFNNSYAHIIINDSQPDIEAREKLLAVFPNMMRLSYDDNSADNNEITLNNEIDKKSIDSLFIDFYALKNLGKKPDEYMMYLLKKSINEKGEN